MESAGIALAALVIAVVIGQLFLSRFNALSGKHFTAADFLRSDIFVITMIITLFTVIAGGSYPAFVLSRFKPVEVLKSKASGVQGGQWFRRTLVTVQYAVAISLTIVAIVIIRQVDLMHKSKLNEKGEQVMMVRFGSVAQYRDFFALKHDLLQDPAIESVSLGDAFPRLDHWGIAQLEAAIPEISNQPNAFNQLLVDFDFLNLFDMKLVAGRGFDPSSTADSLSVVLNESAVKSMNLTNDQVIGTTLSINMYEEDDPNGGRVDRTIIGVVKDFPYKNMRRVIEPLILNPNPNQKYFTSGTMMYVKLPQADIQKKIQFVEATWKKNMPDVGLQYYFVNDLFGRLYKSELTIAALTFNFSVLSIIITVFGLFGLASFDAERKTKEIGVRKVHGASVWQITRLLLASFVKIFLIAAVIVIPIDYYILNDWLTSFQYRTSLDLIVFGGSLGLLLLVTILTVSYETIKAAVANPIDSLRYE
jgi:putative ABC transport system permease protein